MQDLPAGYPSPGPFVPLVPVTDLPKGGIKFCNTAPGSGSLLCSRPGEPRRAGQSRESIPVCIPLCYNNIPTARSFQRPAMDRTALPILNQRLSHFVVKFAVFLVQWDQANRSICPVSAKPCLSYTPAELSFPSARSAQQYSLCTEEKQTHSLETQQVLSFAGLVSSLLHLLVRTRWPRLAATQSPR